MPVLAGAAVLAAIAWVYLLAGHGGYWRTDQRLPSADGRAGPGLPPWPSVVAVVPARDEAAILPVTLPSLLTQDYPGEFSVVLVDDASTDGTAATAAALGSTGPGGRAPRIVPAGATPPGWAGKVHAMAQGLHAAGDCDFVLFTDADISYAPGTLAALVRAALAGNRDLVSQMALLRADTGWERFIVPAFVYFFAQLYPFRWVNRPGSRTAAAAGGCMLVRRAALAAAGGLDPIRGARIDDVALGRLLKLGPARSRCWLGFTTQVRSRRPYPRLAGLWDMVARSAYTQLRYSPALLCATLLGLVWLYAVAPAAVLAGLAGLAAGAGPAAAWCLVAGLAAWALMAISYLPVLRLYRLRPWRAALLPLVALLYAAMTADSARRHRAGRGGEWKGRTVRVPSGPSTANRR
jgi:hopene-associated glycosyltransferase HpnB